MRMNQNTYIWLGYSLFAGIIAYAVLIPISLLGHFKENLMFATLKHGWWKILITIFSTMLAGWLCNLHKGSEKYWKSGLYTVLIFSFFIFLLGLSARLFSEDRAVEPPITPSGILNVLWVSFAFTSIFTVPATLVGTALFQIAIHTIEKHTKLTIEKVKQ